MMNWSNAGATAISAHERRIAPRLLHADRQEEARERRLARRRLAEHDDRLREALGEGNAREGLEGVDVVVRVRSADA